MVSDIPQLQALCESVCSRFERDWQTGVAPSLETMLQQHPELDRTLFFPRLLETEIRLRIHRGETPTVQEYLTRFPDDGQTIKRVLESISTSQISTLVNSVDSSIEAEPAISADPATVFPDLTRYELIRELGAGAFGKVYLAHDPHVERQVAIKLLQPQRQLSERIRNLFLSEARTQARVHHPHVIPIYAVEQLPGAGQWYIVSRYVSGGTLADRLTPGQPMPPAAALEIVLPLADALHACHSVGLYHRDVKPANILFDDKNQVYLSDFGLALHEQGQRREKGHIAGSPAYMAPEQVRGQSHLLDGRADIWSLGVVLYQLLTGERPFQAPTVTEIYEEIQLREPKSLRLKIPNLDPGLEQIVLRCLRKDIAARYLTAADLASDLREWQQRQTAAPASPAPALPVSRQKKWAIGLSLIACLVMALLVWKPWQQQLFKIPDASLDHEAHASAVDDKLVIWGQEPGPPLSQAGYWNAIPKQNKLHSSTRGPSLLILGDLAEQERLSFQVQISEIEINTQIGIFYGYQEEGINSKAISWQSVTLLRLAKDRYVISLQHRASDGFSSPIHVLAQKTITINRLILTLSAKINQGHLEQLQLGDDSLADFLQDYERSKSHGLTSAGKFGLCNYSGMGAFQNPAINGVPRHFDIQK